VGGRLGIALLLLAVPVLSFLPSISQGADSFFLKMTLNGEDKGERLVRLLDDGDFLVRSADLTAMGLSPPTGTEMEVDGEPYRSLKSLRGPSPWF
jgi:hypothetical protein